MNRFSFPDHSATSQILSDLAFHLAGSAIDVYVVTSRQCYDDPHAYLLEAESIDGGNTPDLDDLVCSIRVDPITKAGRCGRGEDRPAAAVAGRTLLRKSPSHRRASNNSRLWRDHALDRR
jgi:hypothetical protein